MGSEWNRGIVLYGHFDIDSIMNEPSILEPEDPLEQNNVKDRHCDGNIHTAVVPADDNTLKRNNVNENANNYFGEHNYHSGGNIITPSAHTTVVTAANNINHGLGRSLMDEIFPYNEQFVCFSEVHDQEAVSALTPTSTASYAANKPFAWLRGKCAFLNPKPEPGSEKFTAV